MSNACRKSTAFPGAWLALTLFTYPYVFLGGARRPAEAWIYTLEEASRSLGQSGWIYVLADNVASTPTGDCGGRASRRPLHVK